MLTVLVKKLDGKEAIYECSTVEKEKNALLLWGDNLGGGENKGLEILGPGGQTMAWDWDRNVDDNDISLDKGADVFVMNDSGKTVARYKLFVESNLSTSSTKPAIEKKRIPVFLENDNDQVIYQKLDNGVVFFKTDVAVSLLDLAYETGFGFRQVDRTALVADDCRLDRLLIKVTSLVDGSHDIFQIVIEDGLFEKPVFNPGQESAVTPQYYLDVDSKTLNVTGELSSVAKSLGNDTEAKIIITVPVFSAKINLATGIMNSVVSPGEEFRGFSKQYVAEVLGYSVIAHYSYE